MAVYTSTTGSKLSSITDVSEMFVPFPIEIAIAPTVPPFTPNLASSQIELPSLLETVVVSDDSSKAVTIAVVMRMAFAVLRDIECLRVIERFQMLQWLVQCLRQ